MMRDDKRAQRAETLRRRQIRAIKTTYRPLTMVSGVTR